MNWKEIKDKYPLSFDVVFNNEPGGDSKTTIHASKEGHHYLCWMYKGSFQDLVHFETRRLYDIFDKAGILIEIRPSWSWTIYLSGDNENNFIADFGFSNREETEKSAFMKGFELLERALITKTNPPPKDIDVPQSDWDWYGWICARIPQLKKSANKFWVHQCIEMIIEEERNKTKPH